MTEVAFHFNVPGKTEYLCRLLRKVTSSGKRALVCLPEVEVAQLDEALWTFTQEDFIPHALWNEPEHILHRSAVVLAPQACDIHHAEVMVNCLPDVPIGFERFERLIEVVGSEELDRSHARQRWKHYVQAGYDLVRHDLGQR